MSEQINDMFVVKISTALSNKPVFVKIHDQNMSIDQIFSQAIDQLKTAGRPLESQQLADLFKEHQIFNNGKVHTKGTLFSELESKMQAVGSNHVKLAELDLVSSHHGGIFLDNDCAYIRNHECNDCVNCSRFMNCLRTVVMDSHTTQTRKIHLLQNCLLDK